MTNPLLEGLVVLDLGDDPAARAARVLGDLGASVIRVVPPGGDVLDVPGNGLRSRAWTARSQVQALAADDPAFDQALRYADVVFDTPGRTGVHHVDPGRAPQAVWVTITPFGATGPRAGWQASDLGVMAASGNMFCTGDPDRAPVRCTEPTAYAHTGPEAAFAALSALWVGGGQRVDVSMQEVVLVANMVGVGRYATSGFRGSRRGANIGRTREIWPTKDGFVSFGLRGGKARVPSLQLLSRLVGDEAMLARDWNAFSPNTATDDELRAIERPVADYFARHTMRELYEIACETNMMLAPANTPPEIYASAQLAARDFFAPLAGIDRFPHHFTSVRHPRFAAEGAPTGSPSSKPGKGGGAWAGMNLLEFGSGAAGRSRRASSRSTARRCCGSSRAAAPTSCASTHSGRTTRMASRVPTCTTASTSASATSRST